MTAAAILDLTSVLVGAFAGCVGTVLVYRAYLKAVLPKHLSKLADEHAERIAPDLIRKYVAKATPESVRQHNRDLVAQRLAATDECIPHLEDLANAYAKHDEARIALCRDKVLAAASTARAIQPNIVPIDAICEGHAAWHAPDLVVHQVEAMEAQYRMSRGVTGHFQL